MFFGPQFMTYANGNTPDENPYADAMQAAKDRLERQMDLAKSFPWPFEFEWQQTNVAWPTPKFKSVDPNWTRNAFHSMADANLRQWEYAANYLNGLPEWVQGAYRAPSEFWSSWFDYWQRAATDTDQTYNRPPAAEPTPENAQAKTDLTDDNNVDVSTKPHLLSGPAGDADDLTVIKGIGKKISKVLNGLGVFHLDQIASWTPENVEWIDKHLQFSGRIERESWVSQARDRVSS